VPGLDAGGVDGEEVGGGSEAVLRVLEERVEPAGTQGEQEQEVDPNAQRQQVSAGRERALDLGPPSCRPAGTLRSGQGRDSRL